MKKLCSILFLCLALLLPGCTLPEQETTPPEQETTLPAPIQWTPVYNDHPVCGVQVQSMLPEGVTKRDLTAAEIASIVPESLGSQGEIYGYVYFQQDGSLYYLALRLEAEGRYATVLLGNDVGRGGCCISVAQENYAQQLCQCGNVEYALFRDDILIGVGRLHGIVRMDRDPEQDQPIFERILENFARYQGTSLSLSELKP